MESNSFSDIQIRPYLRKDRDAVRALCCDTGFLGQAIDPVFEDRELFADFLTDYYLRYEPDSAFVVSSNSTLKGYLLGSRFPIRHHIRSALQNVAQGLKISARFRRYNAESRRFIYWLVGRAWREVPAAPRTIGHFHVNLLPEVRSIAVFRSLLETYFQFLQAHGVKQVHAQMVTFDGRRGSKLFERYGFRVLNQSEITKYSRFTQQTVYLCTIVKELDARSDRLLYPVRQQP
jgi:L-amino acid N-acyltransferase YncA